MSKVLVTGAGGYIGTQLVRDLLKSDHQVIALDRYFFGTEPMKEFIGNKNVEIVKKDIRDVSEKDFVGVDAVCDLACLSNDPAGEMDPELTYKINRDGRIHVAKTAKKAGVEKYIISSSCSVYGKGEEPQLSESSNTNPISVYAKSTLEAEQQNLSIADNNFSVTALRNATVFGLSTRMRFDLVVNLMTLSIYESNIIYVNGGGNQYRPLIHVKDVANFFLKLVEKNYKQEVFNLGHLNIKVNELAYLIRNFYKGSKIEIIKSPDDPDKRNYNVDFSKIKKIVKFVPQYNIKYGVLEILRLLQQGKIFKSKKTSTLGWYKYLIDAKKTLDEILINNKIF
jgi:nucleoside-diphosphate-sugar epimerase